MIEKAKTCGGHNLSGAVMRPGPLEELFPDLSREEWRQEGFAFGEVKKEAIYLLPNGKTQAPHPAAPAAAQPRQRGDLRLRPLPLHAAPGRGGRRLPADRDRGDAADRRGRRRVGVRSGDKGRGKDGEELGNFEPGTDIAAQATVLAEGCWGHLTGAADPRVRPRRGPRAAGLGARRQGGLEGQASRSTA